MIHGAGAVRSASLHELLVGVLACVHEELPAAVSTTVTAGRNPSPQGGGLIRLANRGDGACMVDAQLDGLGGPVLDALRAGAHVHTTDVWNDPRWPALTRSAMDERTPELHELWGRITGAVALPAGWGGDTVVTVSCCLTEPATEGTVRVVSRYERLITAALITAHASTIDSTERATQMLQARAAIEQAKGAVMGARYCDADQALQHLRATSQQFDVPVRELATALVELLGNAPAEQPAVPAPVRPGTRARHAAETAWLTARPASDTTRI